MKINNDWQKTTLIVVMLLSLLQGCANTQNHISSSKPINSWALKGKIAAIYPAPNCQGVDCRKHSDQGGIAWQQQQTNYRIVLSDPFGRTVITLDGDDKTLIAAQPGQAPVMTAPNELALRLLNQSQQQELADLHPDDLRYWVTGRPNPALSHQPMGDSGFQQKGFVIKTSQWRNTEIGQVPSLITIEKNQFRLRLVVKAWIVHHAK